jgi:hypothetical protein
VSWTQADLDTFDAELKARGGVTHLTAISGESISFASLKEAMEFRSWLAGLVNAQTTPPRNIRYAVTDKGV